MSQPDVSIVHGDVIAALTLIKTNGKTPDERRLAELLLSLYESVQRHPSAVAWANNWALEVIERMEAA